MCGRFTLTTKDFGKVADELGAELEGELAWRPRFNVAPTDPHPMVIAGEGDERLVRVAQWGVKKGESFLINAQGEHAAKRFKDSFAHRRCAIPADGFYEWAGEKKARRPIWFHRSDGGLLLFAGLWEQKPDQARPTFMILTITPNAIVAPVHDRMPVVLPPAKLEQWLRHPDASLLMPADDALLVATPVSPRVNAVKNDDPDCLAPPPDEPGKRPPQLKLF